MPRPPAEAPSPAAIRALIDGEGRLDLRVIPGARGNAIALGDGKLLVKVRARPHDGAANAAVLALVAAALGLAKSKVRLVRGATARDKRVQVEP